MITFLGSSSFLWSRWADNKNCDYPKNVVPTTWKIPAKTYSMARENADRFMDRMYALAQVVAVAARSPDALSELNPEAVDILSEVILEDLKQIEAILEQYHQQLR